MWVQIEGKAFNLELKLGFVFVEEVSRNGSWWVKFPIELFGWLSESLCQFSSLVELGFSKKVGFLLWEVNSRCNSKGWFLDLGVTIKNAKFSIFVPAESSSCPWKSFIDCFMQVGVMNRGTSLVDNQNGVDNLESFELMEVGYRDLVTSEKRFLKEGVDQLLELECLDFGRAPLQTAITPYCQHSSFKVGVDEILESECLGFPSTHMVSLESCTDGCNEFALVGSSCVVHDCSDISEAGENSVVSVRPCSSSDGEVVNSGSFLHHGSVDNGVSVYVDSVQGVEVHNHSRSSASIFSEPLVPIVEVVSSFPVVPNVRKKKFNPAKIAIVSFPIEVLVKDNAASFKVSSDDLDDHVSLGKSFAKPCMATRLSRRGTTSNCDPPWDRLPKGVKHHPISKYSEFTSHDVDRNWVLEALELDVKASDKDIFKRMYQFQKDGKIKIKRKIIRILEGLHNDGIRWGVPRP